MMISLLKTTAQTAIFLNYFNHTAVITIQIGNSLLILKNKILKIKKMLLKILLKMRIFPNKALQSLLKIKIIRFLLKIRFQKIQKHLNLQNSKQSKQIKNLIKFKNPIKLKKQINQKIRAQVKQNLVILVLVYVKLIMIVF